MSIMAEGSKEEIVRKANVQATKDGRYVYEAVLGKGGFGVVLKARDKRATTWSDNVVAIKIIKGTRSFTDFFLRREPASVRQGRREAGLLTELEHDNIVATRDHFKGSIESEYFLAIVMEFCPEGDLLHYIYNTKCKVYDETAFSVEKRLGWYLQLASALKFIHSKDIAHRDINLANILVDTNGNLKVADVGLAKVVYDVSQQNTSFEQYMQTIAGTVPYMAPEVWTGHSQISCDIFSMGLVMYAICEIPEMLTPHVRLGPTQYCGLGMHMNVDKIAQTKSPMSMLKALKCSPDEKELFNEMLQYDYHRRPTAGDVVRKLEEWEERREQEERRRREEEREEEMKEEERKGEEKKREENRRRRKQQFWGACCFMIMATLVLVLSYVTDRLIHSSLL